MRKAKINPRIENIKRIDAVIERNINSILGILFRYSAGQALKIEINSIMRPRNTYMAGLLNSTFLRTEVIEL